MRTALHKYANSIIDDWLREGLRDQPLGCNGFFNAAPSAFRGRMVATQQMSDEGKKEGGNSSSPIPLFCL